MEGSGGRSEASRAYEARPRLCHTVSDWRRHSRGLRTDWDRRARIGRQIGGGNGLGVRSVASRRVVIEYGRGQGDWGIERGGYAGIPATYAPAGVVGILAYRLRRRVGRGFLAV